MEKIDNISGNFVFDMDEVLVELSPLQYTFIRNNWTFLSQYFRDLGPLTYEQVMERPLFYMDKWLMKDEYNGDQHSKVRNMIRSYIIKNFFNTDFYSLLNPTKFAQRTLMNKTFIEHSRVKKVYILTKTLSETMNKNKEKFIKKWFNHPKIELVIVNPREKKSEVMKRLGVSWSIFVDDDLRNILDFTENMDISGKEFLIPKTGYNKMPLALDLLIKEKGGSYSYYDRKFGDE